MGAFSASAENMLSDAKNMDFQHNRPAAA